MAIRDNVPFGKREFGTISLGKMAIRDNVLSGKDHFGKMGFGIFGKLGFGIISLREIRYFGQMFHSGNLLFGIMASGKGTFGKCGFGKSSDIESDKLKRCDLLRHSCGITRNQ